MLRPYSRTDRDRVATGLANFAICLALLGITAGPFLVSGQTAGCARCCTKQTDHTILMRWSPVKAAALSQKFRPDARECHEKCKREQKSEAGI
jgi:hypothetical protein